ncbi:unnamed protein product [Paramecium primaurelia]|uniref:Uncharacterized protein n=1 Tax=Paramecium primaurelia TaxID=5886 RepID=A0A8S1QBK6_PARPR|nr:unnamed protein product [Paramecium primaurelia]
MDCINYLKDLNMMFILQIIQDSRILQEDCDIQISWLIPVKEYLDQKAICIIQVIMINHLFNIHQQIQIQSQISNKEK